MRPTLTTVSSGGGLRRAPAWACLLRNFTKLEMSESRESLRFSYTPLLPLDRRQENLQVRPTPSIAPN